MPRPTLGQAQGKCSVTIPQSNVATSRQGGGGARRTTHQRCRCLGPPQGPSPGRRLGQRQMRKWRALQGKGRSRAGVTQMDRVPLKGTRWAHLSSTPHVVAQHPQSRQERQLAVRTPPVPMPRALNAPSTRSPNAHEQNANNSTQYIVHRQVLTTDSKFVRTRLAARFEHANRRLRKAATVGRVQETGGAGSLRRLLGHRALRGK